MVSSSDKAKFLAALRKNPHAASPAVPKAPLTAAKVRRYKERLRAYDAARIELNLATPAEVQQENSIAKRAHLVRVLEFEPRSSHS